MAYPRRRLHVDEEVAVDVRPHGWFYAKAVVALVASIVLGIVTLFLADGTRRELLAIASLILIGVSVLWLLGRYLRWARTRFVVTTERVIFRTGVVATAGIEIPLDRITSVHSRQSMFERLVGAGEIVIDTGDAGGEHRFTDVTRPRAVQQAIQGQLDESVRRRSGRIGDAPDIAAQLERFEAMLARGTLTPEEFRRQKERLLGS